jgi:hypothetical protein
MRFYQCGGTTIGIRFDPDFDPTFHFDDDPDLDPDANPSFTRVGKSKKIRLLFTAMPVLPL